MTSPQALAEAKKVWRKLLRRELVLLRKLYPDGRPEIYDIIAEAIDRRAEEVRLEVREACAQELDKLKAIEDDRTSIDNWDRACIEQRSALFGYLAAAFRNCEPPP